MDNLQWLEINLKNFKNNIRNLKLLLRPGTKFMAVVKSNAYGHGIVECAQTAIKSGARWLGVVNIEEAILLRQKITIVNSQFSILVLGYVEPENFLIAAQNDISIAIFNWEQIRYLKTQYPKIANTFKNLKLKIHIKIETGISRLGFPEKDWSRLLAEFKRIPKNIIIEGIYSHFASVEEYDLAYAKKQIKKFQKFKKLFEKNIQTSNFGLKKIIFHMCASAATMLLPEAHFDMVRCGIAIYGLWPSKEVKISFETKRKKLKAKTKKTKLENGFLKPVITYKTKIVQIKDVKRGDYIGYGCTYPVDKPMTIAVIPVGYAEGFDRGFSNPAPAGNKSGEVLVKGIRCPVVGRVCMNMTIIDISQLISDYQFPISKIIDEEVVLIGKQKKEIITADEWAIKLGTINYEITTRIPDEVCRKYIK